jgi:hypothetical protein
MQLYSTDPVLHPPQKDMLYTDDRFVEKFYDIIKIISPPYAISVDGLWGTGKTSLMKFLQKELEKDAYPTFWFNPWEYRQTESVVLAFLQCFASAHMEALDSISASGKKILHVLLESGIHTGLKFITKGTFSLKDIQNYFQSTEQKLPAYRKFNNTIETIRKEFLALTGQVSKKYNEKPVIIFFDDLDRCLPEDTIQLLEALKNLFVTPECNAIFICGIDTRIAKQFISKHYGEIEEIFAINYFRKIFNLTISMPYSSKVYNLLCCYIIELFEWKDAGNDRAEQLARIIYTGGLQAQIYSIRKFYNIITNYYIFLKFNPDYIAEKSDDFLISLLILKEAWQPLYEKLIRESFRTRSAMGEFVQKILDTNPLSEEQKEYLAQYTEKNSSYSGESLHTWLTQYSTLA